MQASMLCKSTVWTPVQNLESGLVPSVSKINGIKEKNKERQRIKEKPGRRMSLRKMGRKAKANDLR